jgi:hypothetical protein
LRYLTRLVPVATLPIPVVQLKKFGRFYSETMLQTSFLGNGGEAHVSPDPILVL